MVGVNGLGCPLPGKIVGTTLNLLLGVKGAGTVFDRTFSPETDPSRVGTGVRFELMLIPVASRARNGELGACGNFIAMPNRASTAIEKPLPVPMAIRSFAQSGSQRAARVCNDTANEGVNRKEYSRDCNPSDQHEQRLKVY